MTHRDRWIGAYLRRVRFGQFLHRAAEWLAAYLFALGGVALFVKLLLPQFWPQFVIPGLDERWANVAGYSAVVLAGLFPILLAAWWGSRQLVFTRADSAALLDRRLNAGGLLMTLTEAPDEVWEQRLPQVEQLWRSSLPRLRPWRFTRLLLLPLAFIVGTGFVPLREVRTEAVLSNTVGRDASQQLEEILERLDEAAVLEEEEKRQLRDEIKKLEEETKRTPLTHEKWETVDALQERMKMRLDSASLTVAKGQDAVAALMKAQSGEAPELSLERTEQLSKDVLEALRKLSKDGKLPGGSSKLQSELERLMKEGQFKLSDNPAERQEMLDDLQDFLDQESDKLAELRKQCSQCKSGQCQSCGGELKEGQCTSGHCHGNRPGRGGITRGRGDAPLTWGEESDKQGVKFKETVLPPGALDDPTNDVVRVTSSAPTVEPADAAPRSAQRDIDPSAGMETWNRKVRPRHRNVVRQYFDAK